MIPQARTTASQLIPIKVCLKIGDAEVEHAGFGLPGDLERHLGEILGKTLGYIRPDKSLDVDAVLNHAVKSNNFDVVNSGAAEAHAGAMSLR